MFITIRNCILEVVIADSVISLCEVLRGRRPIQDAIDCLLNKCVCIPDNCNRWTEAEGHDNASLRLNQ